MSHSNIRAPVFVVSCLLSPSRYIHSRPRMHTRAQAARKYVRRLYLHISNYFEEDAKWSVAFAQMERDPPFIYVASFLSFYFYFFFFSRSCLPSSQSISLSLLLPPFLSQAQPCPVIDTTNGTLRISPRGINHVDRPRENGTNQPTNQKSILLHLRSGLSKSYTSVI